MPPHTLRCRFCLHPKPSQSAINRHISASVTCQQAWQRKIRSRSTNAAQGVTDGVDDGIDSVADVQMHPPYEASHDPSAHEATLPTPPPCQRPVEIEEVEDVDDPRSQNRFTEKFPGRVASTIRVEKTQFEKWSETQNEKGESPWAPFEDQEEWDLAQWLIKTVGQKSIDEYLKLPIVSSHCHYE